MISIQNVDNVNFEDKDKDWVWEQLQTPHKPQNLLVCW